LALQHDYDYLIADNIEEVLSADRKFSDKAIDVESRLASYLLKFKHILGLDEVFWSKTKLSKEDYLRLSNELDSMMNKT